jgi:hypothetical protein
MKYFYILGILLLLSITLSVSAQSQKAFTLQSKENVNDISIEKSINNDTVISCQGYQQPIFGLSIDMDIAKKKENFLVRILLEDTNGHLYLVVESYKEISQDGMLGLQNYCEETSVLQGVIPRKLHVYVKNATIGLKKIHISTSMGQKTIAYNVLSDSLNFLRAKSKAEKINAYNRTHGKLWFAGVTPLCLKSTAEKFRILGCTSSAYTQGIEYYDGGIFELEEDDNKTSMATHNSSTNSAGKYLLQFDWRNRHGKNWITPVKDQGNSGYCTAFATVSSMEALANLYYNKNMDLDLSEQEIASCSGAGNPYFSGISYLSSINYAINHGVCDENAYPFVDSPDESKICRSDDIQPNYSMKISDYKKVTVDEDSVKKYLMAYGPLVSGFKTFLDNKIQINHATTIVGYKVIEVGDTIRRILKFRDDPNALNYGLDTAIVIEKDNPLIGRTYFVFKDNYVGKTDGNTEYKNLLFDNLKRCMNTPYALLGPIQISNITEDDRICEDADGDGYYNWGLGPKPANASTNIPDEEDGDDSNSLLGPMDEWGNCMDLNPNNRAMQIISVDKKITNNCDVYNHIAITNHATVEVVGADINFHNGALLTVSSGCTLVVNNHSKLRNITLRAMPGASIKIKENSLLVLKDKASLSIPTGATLEFSHGRIE